MDLNEIRDQVASYDEVPPIPRFERHELSDDVKTWVEFGEKSVAPSPVGEALLKAFGLDREPLDGCDCTHCECGR